MATITGLPTLSGRLPALKLDPKRVQALQDAAEKPFLATVGATDLAVEAVRGLAADLQVRVSGYSKDVQKNVASLDLQPRALRDSAVTAFTARVDALQDEARTVPTRVQGLLDGFVDDNVALIEGAYGDLVKRGESLVGRVRRQKSTQEAVKAAETTVTKAKTTTTQATKAAKAARSDAASTARSTARSTAKKATTTAKKRSAAPRSSAKATATAAKKTASTVTKAATDAAQKVGD